MFTGIVRERGTVQSLKKRGGLLELSVHAPVLARSVEPSESVCVNGVCLSVVKVRSGALVFEMIPETQGLTSLGGMKSGDAVNLEPSLSLSDRLGGHILLGHVDGVGRVIEAREVKGERVLKIRVASELGRYLTPKGPVAVDGISMSVGSAPTRNTFTIHVIPETLRRTTLNEKKTGDSINIEIDYLAKLMWQFAGERKENHPRRARRSSGRLVRARKSR